jgi:hypothetical protein
MNTHIPATVVKISDLPEGQPTHLVGVSVVTGKTFKYDINNVGSASSLVGLTDVQTTDLLNGDILVYNSVLDKWVNGEGGTVPSGTLDIDGGTFLEPGGGFSFDGGTFN